MALNEFVYDPNSTTNSALISLVQGTVSFIASQVAKTGNMRVETPTATLGIRGTFVTVDVSSVDGHTVASLGLETNFVLAPRRPVGMPGCTSWWPKLQALRLSNREPPHARKHRFR
jgi:FecR protein